MPAMQIQARAVLRDWLPGAAVREGELQDVRRRGESGRLEHVDSHVQDVPVVRNECKSFPEPLRWRRVE